MRYRKVRYQLTESFLTKTPVKGFNREGDYWKLLPDGHLMVKKGYAWDGATKAIDTRSIMKGSCGHDVFCEAIAAGILPPEVQPIADKHLVDEMIRYWEYLRIKGNLWQILKERILRPFAQIRIRYVYRAVRIYQENKKKHYQEKIYEVP